MPVNSVLVNDSVRLKIKFFDQGTDGAQINVDIVSVMVVIKDSSEETVASGLATLLSGSEYYYDFTPSIPDVYSVLFTALTSDQKNISSKTVLYVNDISGDYKPSITLGADEIIYFAPDLSPMYLDPEELLAIFPDASLIEIGETIYRYSLEVKEIYGLSGNEDGASFPFTVLEYIKASAACDLSRTYGFGGEDEASIKLADLEIRSSSLPRSSVSRANATTWCQIAAALRSEVLAKRVSMKGVLPKGFPIKTTTKTNRVLDPETGKLVYLSDKDLYGPGRKIIAKDSPVFDRGLRQYD